MNEIFYEDLDEIETNPAVSTLELCLWVPEMGLIHFEPIRMTERQRLEAKLIIADRTNDPIKTSSYLYTRDLWDALDAIRTRCSTNDRMNDSDVVSYLDPATNPTVVQIRKRKERLQEQHDGNKQTADLEPAIDG